MTHTLPRQNLRLAKYQLRLDVRLEKLQREKYAERLLAKDATLWPGDEEEIRNRLGWLDLAEDGVLLIPQLEDVVRGARAEGIRKVFLAGMGGSSLAPEVFEKTFGRSETEFLTVADSTHPDAVRRWIDEVDSDRFLFIVSSKSGSTLEMQSLFRAFWHATERWHSQPGLRFVAITDSGSGLEEEATARGFHRICSAPSDVGGRFSALSVFGLVPAALSGVDVEKLLKRACLMQEACGLPESPGVELGAALGELALAGRDKLTFFASAAVASLPNWIEQLVAESLGKEGKGIVPVVDEIPGDPDDYGRDRVFVGIVVDGEEDGVPERLERLASAGHPTVEIRLRDRYDLGAELVRWEIATATAASVLEVQPFDQPDVESTKRFTRTALAEADQEISGAPAIIDGSDGTAVEAAVTQWLESIREGDYVVVQAFLAPEEQLDETLRGLQAALRDRTGCAVCRGYGPRFLHSTGQLHKGGPNRGVFLQLVDRPGSDILVPEREFSFGSVIAAQAAGDAAALAEGQRRILRVRLSAEPERLVEHLRELLSA